MSGDLRAISGAGWLQRTLAMRTLRLASASLLALVAMLLWGGAELSAPRTHTAAAESLAVSGAQTHESGAAVVAARRLADTRAAKAIRADGRHQPLVRSRAGEGDGDPAPTSALATARVALFADLAESARSHLRWLALGHAPYGEPSPFDATAPPAPGPRNG